MATSESQKLANAKYREKNRETLREKGRQDYAENADLMREKSRKYRQAHLEQTRLASAKNKRETRIKQRKSVLEKLGGKCIKCGFNDWRALHVDHINGGGTKERKEFNSPAKSYQDIMEFGILKYQILCANCNTIKRHECGEGCVTWSMELSI